jgi:DNA-directed RNA polymerase specialized sigma24 family protein
MLLLYHDFLDPKEITQLLHDWSQLGKEEALEQLTPLVYDELRRLAQSYLRREREGHTLQPTALIHEAYLRLVGQNMPEFKSRSHFFGVAAQLMRQILVDHARAKLASKRGGGVAVPVSLENVQIAVERSEERIVELRYFGGLSLQETAEAMSLSLATVSRDLRFAEAWLHKLMSGEDAARG